MEYILTSPQSLVDHILHVPSYDDVAKNFETLD